MSPKDSKNVLKEIFSDLNAPISIDAVQQKKFGDKSEGYNIAYLIERLNKVLIPRGYSWDFEFKPLLLTQEGHPILFMRDTIESEYDGKITVKETMSVLIGVSIKNEEGTVVAYKESFGGCQFINRSLGDTLKGAQTDAMKKALSYFGIGDYAFKGKIDDLLRTHYYYVDTVIEKIRKGLLVVHGEKLKKVTDTILMRYIKSVTAKDYQEIEDVIIDDWVLLENDIDGLIKRSKNHKKVKKGKTSNEPKSTDGEDKVPPTEEQVDNPFSSNDEPPF